MIAAEVLTACRAEAYTSERVERLARLQRSLGVTEPGALPDRALATLVVLCSAVRSELTRHRELTGGSH